MRGSYGEIDITPDINKGIIPQGFAGRMSGAYEIVDRLKLQCLILDDDKYHRLAIITSDLFGIDDYMVDTIRRHCAKFGITVFWNASHTHYTAGTLSSANPEIGPFQREYADDLIKQIGELITKCAIDLKPATIEYGKRSIKIGSGRYYNREAHQMEARPDEPYDDTLSILRVTIGKDVHHIINHGCHPTSYGPTSVFAADWPGIVREQIPGSMIIQGACADTKMFCQSHEDVVTGATKLAEAVLQHSRFKELDSIIQSTETPIEINGNTITTTTAKIGNIQIIGIPAEVASETGKKLRKQFAIVAGYTNGLKCYLPTDKQIEANSYEYRDSDRVYNHEPMKLGAEAEYIQKVKDVRYPKKRNNGKAVFCLSTGRCGTMTLAELLTMSDKATVYHHPYPYLVEETGKKWQGIDDSDYLKHRMPQVTKAWEDGNAYIATECNMTPFAKDLERMTDAWFIILMRDPFGFVKSAMDRNYFNGHPWDVGRLAVDGKDQFEKCCKLWVETYKRIFANLPHRHKVVHMEDLTQNPTTTKEIMDWAGLRGYSKQCAIQVTQEPLNANEGGTFTWDQDKIDQCWDICGEFADSQGYKKKTQKVVEFVDTGKPKLAFLEMPGVSTANFLGAIVDELSKDYDVIYAKPSRSPDIEKIIKWADVVWIEWCNQLAVHITTDLKALLQGKKVLIRLHGYEVFTQYPAEVDWHEVDHLIFVANNKRDRFDRKVFSNGLKKHTIYNGVDLSKFSIPEGKKNTNHLLMFGHLNSRKGIPMALDYFNRLKVNSEFKDYQLTIRGDWQDEGLKDYFFHTRKVLGLEDCVHYQSEWVPDLNGWLAQFSHILSFSIEESFHYALGEGMAAGLKPLIHLWPEADKIWSMDHIFFDYGTFFDGMISEYEPEKYRQSLIDNGLTSKRQVSEIRKLIEG